LAGISHTLQVDLRFGDVARKFFDFGASIYSGNRARELFHLVAQSRIGINGQVQPMAARISSRASPTVDSSWPGAGARIRPVGVRLAVARQRGLSSICGCVLLDQLKLTLFDFLHLLAQARAENTS
jgi:hypothetical protein